MNNLLRSILVIMSLFLVTHASAQMRFSEGQHYDVISDTATAEPEVIEFFSFWCPACYNFEPLVTQIKQGLDEDVTFKKVHVNFMGFAGKDLQDDVTRAMLLGRALKQEQQLNTAIFNYIHRQRAVLSSMDDLRSIFGANGVDAKQFDKQIDSFSVKSMLRKNNGVIEEYRRHVTGVPSFIVNGKYKAKFTRDMTADDIIDLIVFLSEMK